MAEDRYSAGSPFQGRLIIINNEYFQDPDHDKRTGTQKDVDKLKETFGQLGFKEVVLDNCTTTDMLQIMIKVANKDLTQCDCLAVVILTHGENDGKIFGTGAPKPDGLKDVASLDNILAPLKEIKNGKPKLIFVQACRGFLLDKGHVVQHDGIEGSDTPAFIRVPTEADFLYHFSSSPGHYSFRNKDGSIFIQALCNVLNEGIQKNEEIDLLKALTRVNKKVAEDYVSNVPRDRVFHAKKQMPSFVCMLRKDVFLRKQ